MLFDGTNGSLIDANWITDVAAPFVFTTPKEAAVVGNQIWVADQVADAVHRFDMNRSFLGSVTTHPTGNLDNIRGFGYDGTNVYLTMLHSTTTLRGVVTINAATATPTNFWAVGTNSLFDAEPNGATDLLITNDTTDNVERRDKVTGALVNNFSTGVVFPQQVATMSDGSVIAVSSIAAAGVEGVYHYNPDGTLRKFIDTEPLKSQIGEQVPRGAWLLGDGGYLIATGEGVYKAVESPPNVFTFTAMLADVDAQYINPIVIPEPTWAGAMTLATGMLIRRRAS
jgi:hypothetical protein